jgi:uncharacterized protein YjbJ (UPF0337 family)
MTTEWHQIAGRWKQCSGANLKKRWGGLTHDERMMMKGNREVLAGTIQERFGVTKLKAKKPTDVRADKLKV